MAMGFPRYNGYVFFYLYIYNKIRLTIEINPNQTVKLCFPVENSAMVANEKMMILVITNQGSCRRVDEAGARKIPQIIASKIGKPAPRMIFWIPVGETWTPQKPRITRRHSSRRKATSKLIDLIIPIVSSI
jgi:hypothetical protein